MAKIVDIRSKQNIPEQRTPKNRKSLKKALSYVGIICFIGVFAYIMSETGAVLAEQEAEKDVLNKTHAQIVENNENKENRIENADDINSIEQTAREKLKYVKDGEILFVFTD